MTETIRKDLDGTIMVIEGLGKRKLAAGGEGPVVHHALAVISFDEKKGTFRWQSWRTPGGLYTETEPVVSEGSFQWGMDTPRGKIRYAGKLDGRGHWVESGEFSSDGNTWHLFFGMDLSR